jgi:Mg-chelatase subunit ChlD
VTNPVDNTDDGVDLTFEDDQGNTASVSDASLNLQPDIEPISFDNEELQLNALDIQLEHINTAFEANASNVEDIPNDIVVVSDESGSMAEEADTRVDATQAFLDAVDDQDRVATVHFSTSANTVEDLQPPGQVDPETNVGGGTNYAAGLQEALDILNARDQEAEQSNNAAIVFLGDGAHNSGPSEEEVRDLAEEAGAQDVTINTIGLGLGGNTGNDAAAEDLLQDMATATGGSFSNVNEADLEETYEEIAENIQNFRINEERVSVTTAINGEAYTFDDDGGNVLTQGTGNASNNLPLTDPSESFAESSQSVPEAEIPSTQEFLNGESVRVVLQFNEHGCDPENGEFAPTGVTVGADDPDNPTDNSFERQICPARESEFPVRATGPGSDRYHVLTEENSTSDLPTPVTEFWQTPLDEALESEGVLDAGTLDLADNEALIIVEAPNTNTDNANVGINPTGYAVFKITANGAVEPKFNEEVLEPGEDRIFGIAVQEVELDE